VKAHWQTRGESKDRFSEEKEYRHSLLEESEALATVAANLEKLNSNPSFAELIHSNESLGLLLKLHRAGLIEPYVLFSVADAGIARDYENFRTKNRNRLEEYLDKFVVPPRALVHRGQLVPYTITANNHSGQLLIGVSIVDRFPAGFTYIRTSRALQLSTSCQLSRQSRA
jgi:uncharacterized repeat protein (TIGR01451 family)